MVKRISNEEDYADIVNIKNKTLRVVKVGSDERPAGPKDIIDIQDKLAQSAICPDLPFVTHHAFDMDEISIPPNCKLVVKVGSDERPAGPDDIKAMEKLIKESLSNNHILVTHHAVEIGISHNKFFSVEVNQCRTQ